MARPKNEIPRSERLNLRLTKFEYEKISKIAEKKNITKTEALLQAIDLFATYKPKKYKSFAKSKTTNEPGTVYENSHDD